MLAESQKEHALNCFNQASISYYGRLGNNRSKEGTGSTFPK